MVEKKKPTFEENLTKLQEIVTELEKGDVPLEQALDQFKQGVTLSKELETTLSSAEKTLTKMMADNGEEVPFDPTAAKNSDHE